MTFLDYLVDDMEESLKSIQQHIRDGNFEYATSTLLSFVDSVNSAGDEHDLLMMEM